MRHTPTLFARLRPALFLLATVTALATGCSDTKDGGDGDGTTGGGNQGCEGAFCLEQDRRIGVTPDKLVFADVVPGTQPQELQLKVAHIGNSGRLDLKAVSFEPPTDEFVVVDFAPKGLQPAQTVTWTVRYTAKVAGSRTLMLVIDNNASDQAKQKLKVPVQVAGGGVSLLVNPNPIDFGSIPSNDSVTKAVQLLNNGTVPVTIAGIELAPTGSEDFAIETMPKIDEPVPAGHSLDLVLRYTPKGGNLDETTLTVETVAGNKAIVTVSGNEIAPNIAVIPPKIDFGAIELDAKATRPFKVLNTGLAKLSVTGIVLHDKSFLTTVSVKPQAPFDIELQKDLLLEVELHASKLLPNNGAPVASLVIASNDPGDPELLVPIYAKTESGALKVTPEDVVDFAFVGKGLKVKRTVELFNEGTAPIEVQKLEITGDADNEFSLVPGNFAPSSNSPAPATLGPGKYDVFQVQFEAKGAVGQKATAKLTIHSTDPQKPAWLLDLVADRAEGTTCKVQIVPSSVNFGLMPYGSEKFLQVGFKNVGTGYCSFDAVQLTDCTTLPFADFPQGPPACKTSGNKYFKTYAPSAKLFNLPPGETGKMQVGFTAPEDLGLFGGGQANKVTGFHGLLVASFKDVSSGKVDKYPAVDLLDAAAVGKTKPNLEAKVGKAAVQVLPGSLDFGVVTVGCKSKPQTAYIYNNGTTDVAVTKVTFDGCGPEVDGVSWPGIPKDGLWIKQSTPQKFAAQYAPQNVGKDQCQMLIYTGLEGTCADKNGNPTGNSCSVNADCSNGDFCAGQLFTVPISGEGTLDDEWTDVFEQGTGKKVDVLFVVDNSGSMSEEQNNLVANFKDFIQIASIWQNDYHLGVVTTDMDAKDAKGRLRTYNGERVVTPKTAPSPQTAFTSLAKVGSNGSGDEQGLAATESALTLPLVYDANKACSKDADCTAPAVCVKGADDGKMMCGGHNRTFLRKNAGLEIVVLSDEEDNSAADPAYYVNLFYSIKGLANKNLFHLHAIVGPKGGCQGSGGQAVAGNRYLAVAQATSGVAASICDTNFAQALKDIGTVAFGLAQQFFLTRVPDPSTFVVKINGVECKQSPTTWSYDEPSNSVTFAEGGGCMPKKGDKISIYYKMLCYP